MDIMEEINSSRSMSTSVEQQKLCSKCSENQSAVEECETADEIETKNFSCTRKASVEEFNGDKLLMSGLTAQKDEHICKNDTDNEYKNLIVKSSENQALLCNHCHAKEDAENQCTLFDKNKKLNLNLNVCSFCSVKYSAKMELKEQDEPTGEEKSISCRDSDEKAIEPIGTDCSLCTNCGNTTQPHQQQQQQKQNVCRICYGHDDEEELLAPCNCLGTVQFIHESCLLTWLKSGATQCELCKTNYQFQRTLRPYQEVCSLLRLFLNYFFVNSRPSNLL